ncbi:MAG: ABC transporter permease [Roseiflexus sp.]|jgi:putative ABC transport system permease protein|nr:ABC transporter permease [Roseiflexus sp.]MBO9382722.1 ABC transporter permease [Roseiflexus sp.]MBO9390023.1 ABC transporter permease [Roseiflexus sp.]
MPLTLLKTSIRYIVRHPWQFGLAILGVALGVAVVVSIDLANDSARRAFLLSTETLTGRTTHRITGGPSGVPEEVYRRLRLELGVRLAAPLVEGETVAPDRSGLTLRILGIDPVVEAPFRPWITGAAGNNAGLDRTPSAQEGCQGFECYSMLMTRPNAALISAETAREAGIVSGARLPLMIGATAVEAEIVGLLEPADDASRRALDGLLIVDIATAQEWMGSVGRLSSIDLIIPDGAEGEVLVQRITAVLPPGVRIERPEERSNAVQQMTAAFELNLSALSLLALVVGTFLIYNTMTFSVVQRRGLIGTLRCIGVSQRQILALTLGEALLIGLIGALAGLALGVALGRGLVGLVTQTINDLYFAVTVRSVDVAPGVLIKGFALGVAATLAAAAVPAAEATLTPPRTVLRRSSYEDRARRAVRLAALAGVALLLIGLGLLTVPGRSLTLSFGGLLALTVGAAALTPLVMQGLAAATRPVAGRIFGLLGRMAARDIVASLSRTSVAVAALMIAVSVTIGVGLMVSSFRTTVERWLENTIRADIFVSAPSARGNRLDSPLPEEAIQRILETPGIERYRRYRSATIESSVGPLLTIALDVTPADHRVFQWVGAVDESAVWQAFARGAALISEPLAYRHNLRPGDTLTLLTDRGERQFPIAGVFYDYGSDQGVAMIDLAVYRELWDDRRLSSLGLYVAPGVDVDELVSDLRARMPPGLAINIVSNRGLRETSMAIFDRTFAITTVLQLLATIVAFIGILAALMALQLERARDMGVLRANGLTPRQLWGLVIGQAGLMGLFAGVLAIPVGIMMAAVLVYVINRRSFGWTLLFELNGALLVQAVAVAVVAALLAGLYPAWRMGRTSPALALREE